MALLSQARWPDIHTFFGPVSGRPYLSLPFCIQLALSVALGTGGAPPGGWKKVGEVRWPDGHTFFAFFIEPAGCGSTVWEPRHRAPASPGAGSPAPEHRSITAHTAFSEFWPSRHGTRVVF